MQQLLIKCWNVYFLPYAFLSPLPSYRSVCLPQRVRPLLSLQSSRFAASSFVSISLFPLPHLQFPPFLSINLFCFPSHWSRVPFPQCRSLFFSPFLLGAFCTFCISSQVKLLLAPFQYLTCIYFFHSVCLLNPPICLPLVCICRAMLLLCQPVSTVADKGQTQYSCLTCLTWSKQLHVWKLALHHLCFASLLFLLNKFAF